MSGRILFVDDERSLLNGIERRLGDDFDITTAESGPDGLQAIEQRGPFPLIFTDMRMPRMDGVEFAEKGRQIAPDSTFIMLTGNQDQETAVRAVNEGRIFRFLNKPCETGHLRNAIADGLRQHELVTAEKELLHRTFTGAVSVLTDVIAASQAKLVGFGQAVTRRLDVLRGAGGIDDRWEFRLAAKLSPLGLSLTSEVERSAVMGCPQWANDAHEALAGSLETTAGLIRGIPRLDVLADICQRTMSMTGAIAHQHPRKNTAIVAVGATLLRATLHWEILRRQGLSNESCSKEIEQLLPDIPRDLAEAIAFHNEADNDGSAGGEPITVSCSELAVGMVLAADVTREDGSCLVRKGRRLSEAMIAKLGETKGFRSIAVTKMTDRRPNGDLK